MGWAILFIMFNCINGAKLGSLGYSIDDSVFWISNLCVCAAYMCGRFQQMLKMWR